MLSLALLEGQLRILERLANGEALAAVLEDFCGLFEALLGEGSCAVMLRRQEGDELQPVAGPSLPDPVRELLRLDGLDAPCTTAYREGKTVIAADLASEPRWPGISSRLAALGVGACWSSPIREHERESAQVVGTVDLYFSGAHEPGGHGARVLELAADLAALAIHQRSSRRSVRRAADYDDLTGLPTRGVFLDILRQTISSAHPQNDVLGVLVVDFDRFKRLNDTFGSRVGHSLLQAAGNRLVTNLAKGQIAARLQGDDLALLVPDARDSDEVKQVAERLRRRLSGSYDFGGQKIHLTASVGVSLYPWDAEDPELLLQRAETAVRSAKAQGRSQLCFYTPRMSGEQFEHLQLALGIGQALSDREIDLLYRPRIAENGELTAVVAALAWQHPVFGLLPAERFVPLAEETGAIGELFSWTLARAAAQLRAWIAAGLNVPLGLEVPETLLGSDETAPLLRAVVARNGLQYDAIELRISEAAVMRDASWVGSRVRELAKLGFHLTLDRVGSDRTDFSALAELPLQGWRLAAELCLPSNETRGLLKGLVALGRELELRTIATGVEDRPQLERMARLGILEMEGSFCGRFAPPSELAGLLLDSRYRRGCKIVVPTGETTPTPKR